MKDITSAKVMYLKGLLFLLAGILAAAVIIIENPTIKIIAMLTVSIWCFARAYYCAFYVVEHYIDKSYNFSGLWSFVNYIWHKRKNKT